MDEWKWWDELDGDDVWRNAWGWPHYDNEAVANFIEDYVVFGTRALDIGCGPGRLGLSLAQSNPMTEFHGVDVSSKMVRISNNTDIPNWSATVNDGRTLPEYTYSVVYAVTVFQHLPHDVVAQYISQVYERLEQGGRLIFTYAVGTEQTKRSYQANHDLALEWCDRFEFKNKIPTPDTHPTWNWMVAQK